MGKLSRRLPLIVKLVVTAQHIKNRDGTVLKNQSIKVQFFFRKLVIKVLSITGESCQENLSFWEFLEVP